MNYVTYLNDRFILITGGSGGLFCCLDYKKGGYLIRRHGIQLGKKYPAIKPQRGFLSRFQVIVHRRDAKAAEKGYFLFCPLSVLCASRERSERAVHGYDFSAWHISCLLESYIL